MEGNPLLTHAPDELGLALLFTNPVLAEDVQYMTQLARTTRQPEVVAYRVAGLMHRAGRTAEARQVLEYLVASSKNPRIQAVAKADLAQLEHPKPEIRIGARRLATPRPPRTLPMLPPPGMPGH